MGLPLLLRGKKLSHIERDATILSASQTPDPLFPLSRLGDARPSQLFMFPLRLEDDYWHADINQYLNGSFENWTDGEPNDHTVNLTGDATIVQESTSPIFVGGSSMELNNGATGTIEVTQEIEALAGETIEFRYAAQTSNADSPATLEIFNPYTRKWLKTDGTWSSKKQNAIEEAGTAFPSVLDVLTFTVENFSTIRNHIVELEVRYHMDGASASRTHHWDGIEWIPGTDFTSIHAHNMSPGIVPRLVRGDTPLGAVPVDFATFFDGTESYSTTVNFTGLSDGRQGTISFWFRFAGAGSVEHYFISGGGNHFRVRRNATNTIQVLGQTSIGGNILSIVSSTTFPDNGWHHLVASWDLTASTAILYIDNLDESGTPTTVNDDIDYSSTKWVLGADTSLAADMNGDIAELWFDDSFINISLASNRLLVRTAAGKAALLGDNGELVTGTSPILYWRGNEGVTNRGTGGDFTTTTGTPEVVIEGTELTKQDISFYEKLATSEHHRYWKLHMRGLNAVDAIETGLWVLGPSITPAWSPRLGLGETRRFPQSVAVVESSGEQWRVRKGKYPRRTATLKFRLKNAQQAAFREELLARTAQGADPIVLVENQNAPKVIHGRIPPESEFIFRSFEAEEVDMVVEESNNGIGLQV